MHQQEVAEVAPVEPKKHTKKKTRTPTVSVEAPSASEPVPPDLEGDLLTVWKILADGEKSPQEITSRSGLPAHKVMIAISKLEFKNLVGRDFGKVFLK